MSSFSPYEPPKSKTFLLPVVAEFSDDLPWYSQQLVIGGAVIYMLLELGILFVQFLDLWKEFSRLYPFILYAIAIRVVSGLIGGAGVVLFCSAIRNRARSRMHPAHWLAWIAAWSLVFDLMSLAVQWLTNDTWTNEIFYCFVGLVLLTPYVALAFSTRIPEGVWKCVMLGSALFCILQICVHLSFATGWFGDDRFDVYRFTLPVHLAAHAINFSVVSIAMLSDRIRHRKRDAVHYAIGAAFLLQFALGIVYLVSQIWEQFSW